MKYIILRVDLVCFYVLSISISHLVMRGRAAKGQCNMRSALVLLVKGHRPGTSTVKIVGK